MEDDYNRIYNPKNKIYIIGDENLKVQKIIGNKEDEHILTGIAMIDASQNLTNADIQEAILELGEKK